MEFNRYFIDEENLICAICLECWVDRDPRMLQCQHTFCFECIQGLDIVDSHLTCPICKEKFQISRRKVGKLQKNLFRNCLIKQGKSYTEEMCPKHDQEGPIFCETHQQVNICIKCLNESHKDCKIITIENYRKRDKMIKNLIEKINVQEKCVEKLIDKARNRVLKEYCMMRQNTIKSFNGLRNFFINTFKNDPLQDEVVCLLRDFIENHEVAIIPEISNDELSTDFTSIYENLYNIYKPTNNISFLKMVNNFQFSFKLIEMNDLSELQMIYDKFRPLFLIQIQNDNPNFFHLENSNISRNDWIVIYKILQKNFKISKIHISRNSFLNDGFDNLLTALENSISTLTEIKINNSCLTCDQAKRLGNFLINCGKIESISLSLNSNMESGLSVICNGLIKSFNVLKSLDFSYCNIDEEQSRSIVLLLKQCIQIEDIYFMSNQQIGNGLLKIFEALHGSSNTIKDINLANCDLNEIHCEYLGNLLNECSNLQKIDLSDNKIMGKGFSHVCNGLLKSANSLLNLNLNGTDLSGYQENYLKKLLAVCTKIEAMYIGKRPNIIDLNDFLYSDLWEKSIESCKGLSETSISLKEIDLCEYEIYDSGKVIVEKMLSKCSRLEIFRIDVSKLKKKPFNLRDCLHNSVNSLKIVEIRISTGVKGQIRNIEEFLIKCNKIEKIKLEECVWECFLKNSTDINLFKALSQSSHTLKHMIFTIILSNSSLLYLIDLLKICKNILSFCIHVESELSILKSLENALKNFGESLNTLNLVLLQNGINNNKTYDYDDLLQICCNLRCLSTKWYKSLKSTLLNTMSSLKELNFYGELTDSCCMDIRELLEGCLNLDLLCLDVSFTSQNGLVDIFKGLTKSSETLKGVYLDISDLNLKQIITFTEALKFGKIGRLNFNLILKIGSKMRFVRKCSYKFPTPSTAIDFANINFKDSHIIHMGNLIQYFNNIEHISLSRNTNIKNGYAVFFSSLKAACHNLKILNLSEIQLNDESCSQVGEFLKHCYQLRSIYIKSLGPISSAGIIPIFEGLKHSSNHLKVLKLGYNDFIGTGHNSHLIELLNVCNKLQEICLAEFQFNDKEINSVCEGLRNSCYGLTIVDLTCCNLNNNQLRYLTKVFKDISTLKELILRGNNKITDWIHICDNIKASECCLRKLDVSECNISPDNIKVLKNLLENTETIKY